jgi:hypothetical protein
MIPFHPSPARRRLVAWLGCGALLWLTGNAQGLEQVSLQLKWWHQFQFAGDYAAQLRSLGVEPATLRALDYGVDFYGDTLSRCRSVA